MLAHISGEQVLKDIFERGEDVHAATAAEMFGVEPDQIDPGMRSKAKMINFGIVYGLSAYGLADRLDIPQDEAAEFIERYLARFPKVAEFIEKTIEEAKETGYVTTLLGRKRRIPELRSTQVADAHAGRAAGGEHADPGHVGRHHQDRDGAMPPARCRMPGCARGSCSRSTTSCCSRRPPRRFRAATEIVVREMAEAYRPRPAAGVDAGAGDNWLAAK